MAVFKVLLSVSIIIIVAVKLEDVRIELQIPVTSLADLTTVAGLANVTSSLMAPTPSTSPSPSTNLPPSDGVDLNTSAGPLHVDAACLLQKHGSAGQLDGHSRTMCSYVFGVCAISLVATFVMTCLLWCTCHLCGWGPVLELSFALLGTAWWLAAALVLQQNTSVVLNASPATLQLIIGNVPPPPPAPAVASLLPPPSVSPPMTPPSPPMDGDVAAQLDELLHTWMPRSLQQWRQAVVGLSWAMMGMFAASSVLLLVEACGCLLDCCGCVARCCCCPDRPESRWRTNMRKKKRMDGEEYVEMCGGGTPSSSIGGGAPSIMMVARSEEGLALASAPVDQRTRGRRGWWT